MQDRKTVTRWKSFQYNLRMNEKKRKLHPANDAEKNMKSHAAFGSKSIITKDVTNCLGHAVLLQGHGLLVFRSNRNNGES